MEYRYITEDNLENKQKYNYSQYCGDDFLEAYVNSRKNAIECIKEYENVHHTFRDLCAIKRALSGGPDKYRSAKQLLDAYVKSFEVRKRLYLTYDENWKPISNDYHDYNNYILFAKVLVEAYSDSYNLKYLSCLMKLDDTLISILDSLSDSCKFELKGILTKELELYKECVRSVMEE